ncbi:MAG: hypothetical protein ACLPVY_24540 [Acidimicrobiia bacterium]
MGFLRRPTRFGTGLRVVPEGTRTPLELQDNVLFSTLFLPLHTIRAGLIRRGDAKDLENLVWRELLAARSTIVVFGFMSDPA